MLLQRLEEIFLSRQTNAQLSCYGVTVGIIDAIETWDKVHEINMRLLRPGGRKRCSSVNSHNHEGSLWLFTYAQSKY